MKKDKKITEIVDVQSFRESWDVEHALYIMQHPTVDAQIWAAAVEWLLLYGPEDVRDKLLSASMYATAAQFPDLKAIGCTPDGELCYDISEMAAALGIDVAEAQEMLREKEMSHGIRHGFTEDETYKVQ